MTRFCWLDPGLRRDDRLGKSPFTEIAPVVTRQNMGSDHIIHGMYEKNPFVYIMASERNGTLYVGVTSNLIKRIWQHKRDKKGFTGRYQVFDLVYFERHVSIEYAIIREKQIKEWKRLWKIRLIEQMNPEWRDLWKDILGNNDEPDVG